MHHATAMRFIQCSRDLRTQLQHLRQRQRPLLQTLGQRFALDALHHQVVDSVLMTDVMQHANVWMIQVRDGFRFALEPLLANRITRKLLRKNLDRNGAIQTSIAGAVDFAHPASAEGGTDFIGSEECPRSERHVRRKYTALQGRLYLRRPSAFP